MTSHQQELRIPQWANHMPLTEAEAIAKSVEIEGCDSQECELRKTWYSLCQQRNDIQDSWTWHDQAITNAKQAERTGQGWWSQLTGEPSPWVKWQNDSHINIHQMSRELLEFELQRRLECLTGLNDDFQELATRLYQNKVAKYSESGCEELGKLRCSSITGGESVAGLKEAISRSYRESSAESTKIKEAVASAMSKLWDHQSQLSESETPDSLPWSVQLDKCKLDVKVGRGEDNRFSYFTIEPSNVESYPEGMKILAEESVSDLPITDAGVIAELSKRGLDARAWPSQQ